MDERNLITAIHVQVTRVERSERNIGMAKQLEASYDPSLSAQNLLVSTWAICVKPDATYFDWPGHVSPRVCIHFACFPVCIFVDHPSFHFVQHSSAHPYCARLRHLIQAHNFLSVLQDYCTGATRYAVIWIVQYRPLVINVDLRCWLTMADTVFVPAHPDAEGDVTLILAKDANQKSEIRVCARVLTLSSSVFATLLGPNFAEGNTPTLDGETRPIELLNDDPVAMTWVCQALHHHESVTENVSIDFLTKIAMICDKYDLSRALRSWSEAWLQFSQPEDSVHHAWTQHLRCAAALGSHKHFHTSSLELLCRCGMSGNSLLLKEDYDLGRLPIQSISKHLLHS